MDEQKPYVINYRMCHESSCETLCTSIYKEIALLLGMNPNIILDRLPNDILKLKPIKVFLHNFPFTH